MSRFSEPQDPIFQQLNASLKFDRRLAPYDIAQSKAHAAMLAHCDIITDSDRDELHRGLEQVAEELNQGHFPFQPDDEDIHMAVERRVTELVGAVGGKLHTARSRNDQVATDVAMYVRDHAQKAQTALRALQARVLKLAEEHSTWALPGYTHLQRAQPVYLGHHLLAYFWMFERDYLRFAAVFSAANKLPLGAGALAGVNFSTDRQFLARELEFDSVVENSIDAVSNRDFVLDYLAAAATCATHLSRLGAEIVLWSSAEFDFCEVGDAFASGSSIMPQKKNPDAAELLRAKAPRLTAHFVHLQGVLHGLPLTYNKDMQEDKEPLFDSVDTLELCIAAAIGMLSGITYHREQMEIAAEDVHLIAATDIADLLVKKGVPFRQSHGIVAGLVRYVVESGKPLSELTKTELEQHSEFLDERFYTVLQKSSWLESKESEGATSSRRLVEQMQQAHAVLSAEVQ